MTYFYESLPRGVLYPWIQAILTKVLIECVTFSIVMFCELCYTDIHMILFDERFVLSRVKEFELF